MTVAELIQQLGTFPPNAKVLVCVDTECDAIGSLDQFEYRDHPEFFGQRPELLLIATGTTN